MILPEDKPARPWDLLNPAIDHVSPEIAAKRLTICKTCPKFMKLTKQCKVCKCIMPAKVLLPHADCPDQLWGKELS